MTRHALAEHAPEGAIFAVSSFGPGASGNRPPAELQPMGLEGPLGWVAEQLEARDRADDEPALGAGSARLAPAGAVRRGLRAALPAIEPVVRVPRQDQEAGTPPARPLGRLAAVAAGLLALGLLAGYDLLAFHRAAGVRASRRQAAPAVARRWSDLLEWHPSLRRSGRALARQARLKKAEWQVKAADIQVANGTAPIDLPARLDQLKDQAPQLVPAIRKVEAAQEQVRHDERWKAVYGRGPLAGRNRRPRDPAGRDRRIPPRVSRHAPPRRCSGAGPIAQGRAGRTGGPPSSGRFVDDLVRSESLPNVSLADQIERARQFLADHAESPIRPEVQRRLDELPARLDEHDIELGPATTRGSTPPTSRPGSSVTRNTSRHHQAGGRFISEAIEAKDRILREWDVYAYRQAYDHADRPSRRRGRGRPPAPRLSARPPRRPLRRRCPALPRVVGQGLRARPVSRHAPPRRGRADGRQVPRRRRPRPGRRDRGGRHRVWPLVRDPRLVPADLGLHVPPADHLEARRPGHDPDHRLRLVGQRGLRPSQPEGDPLAMRLLSGTIKPSKGGKTTLVFASDFSIPTLGRPE